MQNTTIIDITDDFFWMASEMVDSGTKMSGQCLSGMKISGQARRKFRERKFRKFRVRALHSSFFRRGIRVNGTPEQQLSTGRRFNTFPGMETWPK